MKNLVLAGSLIFASSFSAQAATLTVGTPRNGAASSSTAPSPGFGTLMNFDELTPNSTFASGTYAAQGVTSIASPDGLLVVPYSTQSGPNELFDNSANGAANIIITLSRPANEIGVGIADSDGVPITLEALTSTGAVLGSPFTVTLPNNTANPFNGYYVISDTSYDIWGLAILQASGNANYSGLAIDDLQVNAPEPATFALFGASALAALAFASRKRT